MISRRHTARAATIIYILIAALLAAVRAGQECNEYPNYDTNEFTYTICTGTEATNLETSRQFCQENIESSDVITFPNEEEFDFITSVMNKTIVDKEQFKYVPGFFQKKNEANKYNPETGDYFWITDTENKLTNESESHWKPFEEMILRFDENSLWFKQRATFLLDVNGKWYAGVSLGSGDSETELKGNVICMTKGVPKRMELSTLARTEEESFGYWIVIAAAGGVVLLGIIIASAVFCVFKRRKDTQRFDKVPQSENNHNNNSAPKQLDV